MVNPDEILLFSIWKQSLDINPVCSQSALRFRESFLPFLIPLPMWHFPIWRVFVPMVLCVTAHATRILQDENPVMGTKGLQQFSNSTSTDATSYITSASSDDGFIGIAGTSFSLNGRPWYCAGTNAYYAAIVGRMSETDVDELFKVEWNFNCLPLNARTCLIYAARIRGCCVQRHWGCFLFVELDRNFPTDTDGSLLTDDFLASSPLAKLSVILSR